MLTSRQRVVNSRCLRHALTPYHTVWYGVLVSDSKQKWLDAGLGLLVKSGPRALTIDRLCKKLKKTKGSFYHHFAGREAFQQELLENWKRRHTQDLIEATTSGGQQALKKLDRMARALPTSTEAAFREWARNSNQAHDIVTEVDRSRAEHLTQLYLQRGFDDQKAEDCAWLEYALFLGMSQLQDSLTPEKRQQLQSLFERKLVNGDD